ncbi:MAG TPA: alanine racemase, partial [Actinomycetospora sp.]|nr:alanine racemase [Actinomycetospora sp.]
MTATTRTRPRVEARVDLDALAHNVGLLAGLAHASGAATMAVVKADGYGHGAVDAARTALASGASWLGVCTLDEAAALRAAGVRAPVLSWLHLPDEDFAPAIADAVDLGVSSRDELEGVVAGAGRAGRAARVHLKIDTGLSRNGCPPEAWGDLLDAVDAARVAGDVEVVSVWSHLAHADAPRHPTIDVRAARLDGAWRTAAERLGGPRPWRHLANSAATLTRPDLHLDLVRPGIAVYGLDPLEAPDGHGLRPVMTFRTHVALVKRVAAGEGVSYGHEWVAPDDRVLALVPTGYADGVPRRLGGTMTVQLGGRRRPVVGRVCMDQVVVDLGPADRYGADGDLPAVRAGDEVVLFGTGDAGEPTAS